MSDSNPYESPLEACSSPTELPLRKETSPASWIAIIAPPVIQSGFTCSCGHLHLFLLPITLGILTFACLAYSRPSSRTLIGLIGVSIAVLLVGKHIGDILWLGHDPLITFR